MIQLAIPWCYATTVVRRRPRLMLKFLVRNWRSTFKIEIFSGNRYMIFIFSTDKPSTPSGPVKINRITSKGCCLSWGRPVEDGGAEITHYIVEKKETSRLK